MPFYCSQKLKTRVYSRSSFDTILCIEFHTHLFSLNERCHEVATRPDTNQLVQLLKMVRHLKFEYRHAHDLMFFRYSPDLMFFRYSMCVFLLTGLICAMSRENLPSGFRPGQTQFSLYDTEDG